MPVGPIGVHPGPTEGGGAAPPAPVISGVVRSGDGTSAVISIIGTNTIRLYYKIRHVLSWVTGLTRTGSGNITQTGLVAGKNYEFYCVADDSGYVSPPSNLELST